MTFLESNNMVVEDYFEQARITNFRLGKGRIIKKTSKYVIHKAHLFVDKRLLWIGDINIRKDKELLEGIADRLQKTLYIVEENKAKEVPNATSVKELAKGIVYPQSKIEFE